MKKVYLGDSVYGERVGESIKLTTENGFGPSNEIWIDMSVLYALILFIQDAYHWEISVQPKGGYNNVVAHQHDDGGPRRETEFLRDQDRGKDSLV